MDRCVHALQVQSVAVFTENVETIYLFLLLKASKKKKRNEVNLVRFVLGYIILSEDDAV